MIILTRIQFERLFIPGLRVLAKIEGLTLGQYIVSITDEEEIITLLGDQYYIEGEASELDR